MGLGGLRAQKAKVGGVQDGCGPAPGRAAALEDRPPAGLRATAAGESTEHGEAGRGLGARLTVIPFSPENPIPVWALVFPFDPGDLFCS